jgi:hypothetical protein
LRELRSLLALISCVLASSLTACSSEAVDMTTTASLGDRWKIEKATGACNAESEKKRWGTLAAMLSYEQTEPDHGFAKCMAPRLN